jgi:Tfp pilus assembly protein PilF
LARSIELFGEAIDHDPNFARAHVGLAQAHAMMPTYLDELELPYLAQARASLDRAEALGHTSARLLGTRAYVSFREWRWTAAHDYFERALKIAPNDSDIRQQYSQFLGTVGRIPEALAAAEDAVRADPLSGVAHQRLAVMYLWIDDLAQARHHLALTEELGIDELATPEAPIAVLARARQYDEVDRQLRELQRQRGLPDDWIDPVLDALRGEAQVTDAVGTLNDAYARHSIGSRLFLGALYFLGDEAGFFEGLNLLIDQHAAIDTEILFTPIADGLRASAEFEPAMRRMGITDYWRERGPPDSPAAP